MNMKRKICFPKSCVILFFFIMFFSGVSNASQRLTFDDAALLTSKNLGRDVTISGVLGYSTTCKFTLYRNKSAMEAMDKGNSILLRSDKNNFNKLGEGYTLKNVVGRYVSVSGTLSKDNLTSVLRNYEVFYSFEGFHPSIGCNDKDNNLFSVYDVIAMKSPEGATKSKPAPTSNSIYVLGVLGANEGVISLYPTVELAQKNIWTESLIVFSTKNHESKEEQYLSQYYGKLVKIKAKLQFGRTKNHRPRLIDVDDVQIWY